MHGFHERRYLIPFRATLLPQIFTDVLVIGTGVAGMRAALSAAGEPSDGKPADDGPEVIIVGKGPLQKSSTYWAQGGIAAVLDADDSIDEHVSDTLVAGAGLCDAAVVRSVVEAGPRCVNELIDWGMPFDRSDDALAFGREGGHSRFRVLHSDGDATGKALALTLAAQTRAQPRIRHFEECFVLDLITTESHDGGAGPTQCLGVITHHPRYGLQVIWAQATILASGGCGQVFRESTNPGVATGDGLAMASRAGAELMDLPFMQFHPTTLYVAGASRSLITEAVRGEGAHLIDRHGQRFMFDYDERGELAPRDIVSRAILQQMGKTGHTHVYLDVRHLGRERFGQRFPGIAKLLEKFDIDPGTTPVPVHPSAHYMIGGVRTDAVGRTSIPGLYAAGEVACTGLHGANRLASNSLLEGLVFGALAGRDARAQLVGNGRSPHKIVADIRPSDRSELDLADVRSSLRSVMWRHVGIEREGERLAEVSEMFEFWARYTMDKIFDDRAGWEVQNMLTVGALMTRAARWREESRGTHFRVDHPEPKEAFRVHDVWLRGRDEPTTRPVAEPTEAE
ncbi:L-aspartate oxidase [Phycisphaerales bacterium AB-hyl4]|uniref:L-aspartate oxidase n=1 Tax=Natronomicrosphaera hydrolytica TaxID=3242702 RepID=A0ABV4U3Y9_9BACT